MSANSKIVFVPTDPTGAKTCQEKFNDAVLSGTIDGGDIAILEDSMHLVYVDSSDAVHRFPFSEPTVPKKFDSLASVDPSVLELGEVIAVKDTGDIYNVYAIKQDGTGAKTANKVLAGDYNLDTMVSDISTLKTGLNTANGKITTNTTNIATNTGKITTNTGNIATNTANITTLQTNLTALEAKVKQSDWNQNTTTAWDYIKNRPFYTKADGTKQKLDNDYLPSDLVAENSITIGTKDSGATTGAKSLSVGTQNYVSGEGAFGSGYKVEAKGIASHAEGYGTKANSMYGHAEGRQTTTGGRSAHAENEGTTASGDYSHAEGQNSTATGLYSHAEGHATSAVGNGSHSEGIGTIAQGVAQHVGGKYNVTDPTALEVIGKGTGDSARSNARVLDANGNETLAGTLTVGADPTSAMQVTTKQYVDGKVTNLDYSDTAVAGKYVSEVDETDGVIAVTRADLPVKSVNTTGAVVKLALDTNNQLSGDIVDGSVAKTKLATAVQTSLGKADDALQPGDIINNLTSTASNKVLSASQGKALKDALDGNTTDITTLKGTDTVSGSVANKIKTAVQALDYSDTAVANKYVSEVDEVDGIISVTRADIPVRSVTTGSALGTIAVNGSDVVVKDVAAIKSSADTNKANIDILNGSDTTAGSVAKAVKTAKTSLETSIGTLSGLQTTVKTDLVSAVNEVLAAVGSGGTGSVVAVTKQATPDTGYKTTYNITQGGSSVGKINTKDHEYTGATGATQVSVTVNNTSDTVSAELINGGVSTAKIADGAVSTVKIADNAITSAKIADGTIATADLADGNVTKAKLATAVQTTLDQVDTNKTNIGTLSSLTTTNKTSLVNAVNSVKADLTTAQSDLAVTVTEAAGTGDIAKKYTLKQGGTQIGVIDIAKNLVVQSGSVDVNPSGQPAGTYLVLTLNDTSGSKIYINVAELANQYTVQANAPVVQLAISATNEISASIKNGSIGTVALTDGAITTVKIADGNVTKTKLETSVQTSLGKADSAVQTIATGTANGTIKVDGTDVAVKGLGSAAYTASTAYDSAGTANTVKTTLLGAATDATTAMTINGVKNYVDSLDTAMDTRVSALEAGGGGGGGGGGDIATAINALNVADTPVAGKYVSGVSETKGKITVTRADFPSMTGNIVPLGSVTSTYAGSNVSYTPEGTVTVTAPTVSGTNTAPTFTGTQATITPTITANSTGTANYTPAGTVSAPTITNTYTTGSVTGINSVGTLASCTMPVLTSTVTGEKLTISWTAGTYTAATLPTKATAVSVVTGVASTATAPTFTGTGTRLTASATYTPAGTVSAPTWSGTVTAPTATFAGKAKNINSSGTVTSTFTGSTTAVSVSV